MRFPIRALSNEALRPVVEQIVRAFVAHFEELYTEA